MANPDTPSYAAELEVLSKDEVWKKIYFYYVRKSFEK